jgi:hypothetical protein
MNKAASKERNPLQGKTTVKTSAISIVGSYEQMQ